MKNKGFLLVDIVVSIFIFIVIILNLLVILNKNFENMKKLVLNQEKDRLMKNIENIIERDFNEKKEKRTYYIIDNKNKLILKNNREEEIGKFKYISKDNIENIKIIEKDVVLNNKNIGKIFFSVIEIDGQYIENIIEE